MNTVTKKIAAVFMSLVVCVISLSFEPRVLHQATASTAGLVDGIYIMRQTTSGKSINIAFGDMGNGARATIHDDVHQVELKRLEDSTYSVKIVYSQLYLDVQFAWKDNGNAVVQGLWHDGNTDNLRWYIIDHGNAGYELVAKHSGKALDVEGGVFENGVGLQQYERNNSVAQRFSFQLIEPTVKTYTVRYNANGGTGTMADQTFTIGMAQTLRPNTFTRIGYTFQGWATSATGGVIYSDKQSITNLSMVHGATVTLYAVWKPITYTVKFNANSGTGTMADLILTYDAAKVLTANTFTRTGYTFQGWATSATGGVVHTDGKSVVNLATTQGAVVDLHAVWKANTYTVKYNANSGTGTMADSTHTYGTAKELTANAFVKSGHSFMGWAKSAAGEVVFKDKESVKDLTATNGAIVTLYAIYKQDNITIIFDPQGGSCPANSKSVTIGKTYGVLPTPTKSGVSFGGWFTEKDGKGKPIKSTEIVDETKNFTVFAYWVTETNSQMIQDWVLCKSEESVEDVNGDDVIDVFDIVSTRQRIGE